jgi:TonB-linked SusC/RagA family outer membrane protein
MQGTVWWESLVKNRLGALKAAGMVLVLAFLWGVPLQAQTIQVSGRVTDASTGDPIADVRVMVAETDIRGVTDPDGRYTLNASPNGVLVVSAIGYRAAAVNIAGRTTIDIALQQSVMTLTGVVVTGYAEQRRADITGAVSGIDLESLQDRTSASVLQRLDGEVAGVTVEASGSPGSRSTVRIRGVSSFQNNDPLYIVDGTPVEGSYFNWLNPNDIESMQVLKDASAASIYGARAANGVVIIETRKQASGRSDQPRFSLDVRTGISRPVRGYDDFLILDALEYHEVVKRSYENAGLPVPENIYGDPDNPTVPAYIWPNDGVNQTTAVDTTTYAFPDQLIMRGSPGTNWWDAVFGTGYVADANLAIRGRGEGHGYNVSFNYFNNDGTAAHSNFRRYSARANTQFTLGRFHLGENMALAYERFFGGAGDPGGFAEGGILGKNILMQPVVPVYDVGGNFAAGKAVTLGNQSNPLKEAFANKDDVGKNLILFGNVFGGVDLTRDLSFTSRFGFNLVEYSQVFFDPIDPELSEPSFSNGLTEQYNTLRDWTWSNVFNYRTTFGRAHNVATLLGQEATKQVSRFNSSGINNLITTDINARYIQDAIGDAATKNVSSSGNVASLVSFFGKIDYNYDNRYYLSATLRRDGSSRLGPNSRWGTFPAFSAGWRASEESFLRDNSFFTNVMLRASYGVTGNQNIPAGRIVSQFGGGRGDTFYDIAGTNTQIEPGFRQTALGNPDLKWEEARSTNVGLDLEFFGGDVSLIIDAYRRVTDNLLFAPQQPATAGTSAPPIVNIGEVKNTGFDVALGFQGTLGATGTWNVTLNGAHYKNEIVRIDGVQDFFFGPISTRFGNQVINQVGAPIGAFYGLEADGFFEDNAAVAAHATQDGAAPGRIRFVDQPTDNDGDGVIDGPDGQINAEDRVIIGSPHPDFTLGLDLGASVGRVDVTATFFGSFGNDIFNVQKEFYVFRNFSTNVRRDLLTHSWELGQDNTNAKYPRLDVNDTFSGQQISSYYVEDGSYLRLRSLQVGYQLPESLIPGTRVYVIAENLFTLTGYSGLDPVLPAAEIFGPGGDVRDQYRGVDRGAYPSNRTFSVGFSTSF